MEFLGFSIMVLRVRDDLSTTLDLFGDRTWPPYGFVFVKGFLGCSLGYGLRALTHSQML